MFHITEANPAEINYLCPKASFGADNNVALRPFSACGSCPHMSHMNCCGLLNEEKLATNVKKGLQSF